MNRDLTVGKPGKVLINFTIPMFISVVFQQLYNIADSIIAGKFAGEDALAAVGASYPITMIFMAVAIGSQIGCSVVISRHFGNKDYTGTKVCITTSLISGVVLSFILMIIGVVFSSFFMRIVNTPSNIFADGEAYLKIYTAGFMFLFLYNITTGVFNSLGDSKTPLYLLIASSIGNIVLDSLFVIVFKWGVRGVAWATFIAQGIACILSLIILASRVSKLESSKTQLFCMSEFKNIMTIAGPSILQQSFISIGNMFIQYMVNGFGSSVIAGYSAAIKLNTFAITSFTTLGNGISSFTAQNMGAGKNERVKHGLKAGIMFALSVATFFFLLFFLAGKMFILLFMNGDSSELAIETGMKFIRIVSPFYLSVCIKLICDGVLRGSESMRFFMVTTFTDLIMRVILAFIFSKIWQQTGIWLAWPLSWFVSTVMSFVFCKKGVWMRQHADKQTI